MWDMVPFQLQMQVEGREGKLWHRERFSEARRFRMAVKVRHPKGRSRSRVSETGQYAYEDHCRKRLVEPEVGACLRPQCAEASQDTQVTVQRRQCI